MAQIHRHYGAVDFSTAEEPVPSNTPQVKKLKAATFLLVDYSVHLCIVAVRYAKLHVLQVLHKMGLARRHSSYTF